MRRNLLLLLFVLSGLPLWAQNLPLSTEYALALSKGTRSASGAPGTAYWQNSSDYTIKATFDPATRLLRGSEVIIYHNNSPDSLAQIVMRLYPDIFRKDATRDGTQPIDPEDLNDKGVELLRITANGQLLTAYTRKGTNLHLPLPSPLKSKSTLKLEVSWQYFIPAKTHIREGTYFQTSFMIAYWYPQVAVYDDVFGWDEINYTGQQEFYNDFNNYDVEITILSSKHLVWATGDWLNPEATLTPKYLERYQKARTQDEVTHIVNQAERFGNTILKAAKAHTYHYRAQEVPDFVFAASDTYLWDMASVEVEPGRRTVVGAVYHPDSRDFYQVTRYAREAVDYFSHKLPGVPFPFPQLIIFNGDGGMEFPMMVNDGSFDDNTAAEVAAHEIAHTYFPFYMGINEHRFAWMDEGWAQTLPNEMEFVINKKSFKPQQQNALYYSVLVGRQPPAPLMTPSYTLTDNPYANASYFQPSLAYTFLREMLGAEQFGQALRSYMSRWHGKHPQPWDFFNSFSEAAEQDLNWYWKPWFFRSASADLAIRSVQAKGSGAEIVIEKKGLLPVPVVLKISYEGAETELIRREASVWKEDNTLSLNLSRMPVKVELGTPQIPDTNPKDNKWPF